MLPALDRAAALLVFLENNSPGTSKAIFSHLNENKAKILLRKISALGQIDETTLREIVEEFYSLAVSQTVVYGGKNVSEKILKLSESDDRFDYLKLMSDEELLQFFERETLQLAALALSNFEEDRLARLISKMPSEKAQAISTLILNLDPPNPDLISKLHSWLGEKLSSVRTEEIMRESVQLAKLSRVIEGMPDEIRTSLMESLNEGDNPGVEKLNELIFTFEDLVVFSDRELQDFLYEMETPIKDLAVCLKSAEASLRDKIITNLPDRAKAILKQELDTLPPEISPEAVDKAKLSLVKDARHLEKLNKIPALHLLKRSRAKK